MATRAFLVASSSVAALVLALAAACSDATTRAPAPSPDAGAEAAPPSSDAGADGAACALPGSFGSAKCNECVATSCCKQLAACEADRGCRALRTCILPCLDAPDAGGCAGDCMAKNADDAGLWYEVETCWTFSEPCDFHCGVGP